MKFSLVLVLFSVPLFSQQQPGSAQTLSQEIVVTASGVPESVESSPAAVSIIRKKEIDERGLRDVADALREVPGLSVVRSGSPGKITTLFTRGSNSTHTLILWNGVEANNPFFSGYDWGRFSVAGVDRIEVVRGPYSALYGSDAVAGVVNVQSSSREGVEVGLQAGENGLFDAAARAGIQSGNWSVDATLEQRQDDGFAPNDDLEQQTAIVGAGWSSGATSLGLRLRFMEYDLGIPFSSNASGTAFEPRPDRREGGNELQLALPVRFDSGAWHHELTLSRNQSQLDFKDPQDSFGRTFAITDTYTNRALYTARVTTGMGTLVGGAEYERGSVHDESSYGVSIDDQTRTSRSLFLEDRISLSPGNAQIELTLGVRFDDFDSFGSETSPRVAAAWIAGRNKIRAAYGHAFRAPSIGELYIPFFGNDRLEAERTRSGEVGFDHFFASGAHVAVTLFQSDFENLIVYDNVSQVFQNIGAARSRGLEVGLGGRVHDRFTVGGSYTWLDTEAVETGEALLRRPEHSGSFSAGARFGSILTNLVIIHSGERADVTDLFPFGRVVSEAYTLADLKIEYDAGAFAPYLKIENLTNEEYQEIFGYPSPRRRAIAGFRWSTR